MKKINKVKIGGIVAGVVVISLITFVIIRRNKNKKFVLFQKMSSIICQWWGRYCMLQITYFQISHSQLVY